MSVKIKRGRFADLDESKFFGEILLPEEWLKNDIFGENEIFLCQIKLEDVAVLDKGNLLPKSGTLYFFIDESVTPVKGIVRYFDGVADAYTDFNEGFEDELAGNKKAGGGRREGLVGNGLYAFEDEEGGGFDEAFDDEDDGYDECEGEEIPVVFEEWDETEGFAGGSARGGASLRGKALRGSAMLCRDEKVFDNEVCLLRVDADELDIEFLRGMGGMLYFTIDKAALKKRDFSAAVAFVGGNTVAGDCE